MNLSEFQRLKVIKVEIQTFWCDLFEGWRINAALILPKIRRNFPIITKLFHRDSAKLVWS